MATGQAMANLAAVKTINLFIYLIFIYFKS